MHRSSLLVHIFHNTFTRMLALKLVCIAHSVPSCVHVYRTFGQAHVADKAPWKIAPVWVPTNQRSMRVNIDQEARPDLATLLRYTLSCAVLAECILWPEYYGDAKKHNAWGGIVILLQALHVIYIKWCAIAFLDNLYDVLIYYLMYCKALYCPCVGDYISKEPIHFMTVLL